MTADAHAARSHLHAVIGRPIALLRDHLPGHLHERLHGAHAGMYGLASHAGWYDALAGRIARRLYERVADDVAKAGLPDGAFVLDAGTGPGRVPRLVARRCEGLRVEGIDLSEAMIDTARRAAERSGAAGERLTFRVGDVTALPYDDGSIDLVVSCLSLHHWADARAGLAEIQRVLRPGGHAWIYDIRPVLERASTGAARQEIPTAVEPLGRLTGRFLGRLTLTAT